MATGAYTNAGMLGACTLKCTLDCRFRQAAVSGGAADAGPGAPRPGAARPLHLWADRRARVLRRIRSRVEYVLGRAARYGYMYPFLHKLATLSQVIHIDGQVSQVTSIGTHLDLN